jgi:hypothetical protein
MDYQALLDQAAEELAQCCAIATTLPDGTLSRKLWFEYHFYYARCLLFCVRYQEVCVCVCAYTSYTFLSGAHVWVTRDTNTQPLPCLHICKQSLDIINRALARCLVELESTNTRLQTPYEYGLVLLRLTVSFLCKPRRVAALVACRIWRTFDTWPDCVREAIGSVDEAFASLVSTVYPALVDDIRSLPATGNVRGGDMSEQHTQCIMLLGESHTLVLSWREVVAANARYRLVPYLVMGAKAWHFRVPFNSASKEVAIIRQHLRHCRRGQLVVLVVGEVDCRVNHGIAAAVHKGKYRSVADAVVNSACAFVDGCVAIMLQHGGLHLAIHPVRPPTHVDPESSRDLVSAFNAAVMTRVAAIQQSQSVFACVSRRDASIRVLASTFDALVDANGWLFEKYFLSDYQHLDPAYYTDGLHASLQQWLSQLPMHLDVATLPIAPRSTPPLKRYPFQCELALECARAVASRCIAIDAVAPPSDSHVPQVELSQVFPHWFVSS